MIRGRSGSLYREGLGDLLYKTTGTAHTSDYLSSAIAAPVFSFGVPCGIWMGSYAGGNDTRNVFGANANLRLRVRCPYQYTDVKIRPTIVYTTGADGTYSISVTAVENGSGSSTVSLTADTANPTLETFADAEDTLTLEKDTESSVFIEVTFDGDLDGDSWCCIHSISLWPEWNT